MPLGVRSLPGGGGALVINAVERVRIMADANSPLEMLVGGTMRKVVESGSNANGSWVRFADGTQVCDHFFNIGSRTAFGSGTLADPYRTGTNTWTYPVGFSVEPVIILTPQMNTGTAQARATSIAFQFRSSTACSNIQMAAFSSNTLGTDGFAFCAAVGRWY